MNQEGGDKNVQHNVLWVDDEPQVISSFKRLLPDKYQISSAHSGKSALEQLATESSFSVIITDMTMPEMNGIEFLQKAKEKHPEPVYIMLTGNQDLKTAVQATNVGEVFRYLNKPISIEAITSALQDAVMEYEVNKAKKELLDKTLGGCVHVLMEVIRILDSLIFSENLRTKEVILDLRSRMNIPHLSSVLLANMLSGVGLVSIPTNYLVKYHSNAEQSAEERKLFARVPAISESILSHIPRLEEVCTIIRFLGKNYDGTGYPSTIIRGQDIPWGSRFLRIVKDLSALLASGGSYLDAIQILRARVGWYDPHLLDQIQQAYSDAPSFEGQRLEHTIGTPDLPKATVSDLRVGQRTISNIETVDGVLLLEAGEVVSTLLLERIRNYAELIGVKEPIYVDSLEPTNEII